MRRENVRLYRENHWTKDGRMLKETTRRVEPLPLLVAGHAAVVQVGAVGCGHAGSAALRRGARQATVLEGDGDPMSNDIPTASRLIVGARDNQHCVRCGGKGNEWHHRRRRGVKDSHTHAACNGITLCFVCHAWCHANARIARSMGWIVSAHGDPHEEPVFTFMYSWVLLNHDGTLHLVNECEQCETVTFTESGLCLTCLRAEVCCRTPQAAAASYCGCGGAAAMALERLMERVGEREA